MIRSWFPEFSHIEEFSGREYFVTTDGCVGIVFEVPNIDLDRSNGLSLVESLSQITLQTPSSVLVRIHSKDTRANEVLVNIPRIQSVREYGYRNRSILLGFELSFTSVSMFRSWFKQKNLRGFKSACKTLEEAVPFPLLEQLGARELKGKPLLDLVQIGSEEITADSTGISKGGKHLGVLRLWRQGARDIDEETLAELVLGLEAPFEVRVSSRALDPAMAQYVLKRQLGKSTSSSNPLFNRAGSDASDALEGSLLSGDGLSRIEWILLFERPEKEDLLRVLKEAKQRLMMLGEIAIETFGGFPSYRASLFGSSQHYTFLEKTSSVWAYLPVLSHGQNSEDEIRTSKNPERSLVLHREDESLFLLDPFAKKYGGLNCITNGIKGSGKSVLNNLLSKALLADPTVRMFKIDVGGSYRKECSLYGGRQFSVDMNTASGINPFSALRELPESPDVVETLGRLVGTLIMEAGEKYLPKGMEAAIEKSLFSYAELAPQKPSLRDFYEVMGKELPRKELLERWVSGLYKSALAEDVDSSISWDDHKYFYFNFSQIKDAGSSDYSKGIVGAVIALINIEMLKAGDALSGNAKRRIVLFVDEAPFFVEQNAKFFKLTTANFRKYGHGTVLIAQSLQSFEFLNESNQIDRGIITNSPIRFLFEIEGKDSEFCEKFGLSEVQLQRMKTLHRGSNFRECFMQFPGEQKALEGQIVRIITTPREYWEVTSDDSDNEKLAGLMKNVPGLTLKEAIRCLSTG